MKCKNTRSSGKTLGVAPLAWTWEQTLIAATVVLLVILKAEHLNLHDVCCTIPDEWRHIFTEPEPYLSKFTQINVNVTHNVTAQIKYSNLETEPNVTKKLNKIIKSKSVFISACHPPLRASVSSWEGLICRFSYVVVWLH